MIKLATILLLFFISYFVYSGQSSLDSLNKVVENSISSEKFDDNLYQTIDYIANYYELYNPKAGVDFIEKLINHGGFSGKSRFYGLMYSWLGKYHRVLFSPENSLKFLLLSEKFFSDAGDKLSLYYNYSDIGHIYFDYRQFNKSINYYIQSYHGFNTDINDTSEANQPYIRGLSQSLIYMGLANEKLGNYQKAIEELELSLELRKKLRERKEIPVIYRHLARNHGLAKRFGKAFQYYDSVFAYQVPDIKNDPLQLTSISMVKAEAFTERAWLFVQMDDINKANRDINEAELIYSQTANYVALVKAFDRFARALADKKHTTQAFEYLHKANKIALNNSLNFNAMLIARKLSELYESSGNQQMAFKYLSQYRDMNDSLFRHYLSRSIENAELNIRMSEKVRTIEELEKEARLISAELSRRNLQLLLVVLLAIVFIILTVFYVRQNSMRKNFAEVLKDKNHHLTKANDKLVVSEQQLELKNKELIKKNMQLENLNNTKDKLFSILSHDLKNAVGSFKNLSDLLHDNYEDLTETEKRDFVLMIQDSSKKLFMLLENLLTWSRSQRGLIQFSPAPHEIHKLIQKNINLIREQLKTKKITLINEVDGDLIAYFDYSMIDTVVRNLLSNAVKFTDLEGMIIISTGSVNGQDDRIRISIEDSGIGMDKRTLNRLFRITQQKSKKGTQGEQGSGLGLIICREFVEKNGGRIWAESKLYEGTKFHFTLPLHNDPPKKSHPVESDTLEIAG